MIVVHHLNNSRSQRILWLLEELAVPYQIESYRRDAKTNLAPPELRTVHPLGKSPVIRDGDLVLFKPGGECGNRSIVLMTNKWGEVILRRYRVAGNEVYFSPENTAYAPFKADANTKIFGTVIDIWRRVKL